MQNYLLIDIGNSYIKTAIYKPNEQKIVNIKQTKLKNVNVLLSNISKIKIDKIFESSTAKKEKVNIFNKKLTTLTDVKIKVIERKDFDNLLDLSNIDKNVYIGSDILLMSFYGIKTFKKGIISSLGSVYVTIIFDHKINSVLFIPSICFGLSKICKITAIKSQMIPNKFNKTEGLNTIDAFAAGANLALDGYLTNLKNNLLLNNDQVIITGGDSKKFANLKKFKLIDNLVLISLMTLIKVKKW